MQIRKCNVFPFSRGVMVMLVLTGAWGCQSPRASRDQAVSLYERGHYMQALEESRRLSWQTDGQQRDEASYLAGMCAYQLGRDKEACSYLRPLARHDDPAIAGPVNAALGLIYARQNNNERALTHLRTATGQLRGDQAAQALYHQGLVEQRLGWWNTARSHMEQALNHSVDPQFRQVVRQRLEADGYVLQLGAYENRHFAERYAAQMHRLTVRQGLGAPRVVPSQTITGRTLYLVQVSHFKNHAEAVDARRRLPGTSLAIVPSLDEP
jgi:tetratricopeptide (TPR) repeat protein